MKPSQGSVHVSSLLALFSKIIDYRALYLHIETEDLSHCVLFILMRCARIVDASTAKESTGREEQIESYWFVSYICQRDTKTT